MIFIYLQLTYFFKQSQVRYKKSQVRYKNRQLEFPPGDFRLASEFLRFVDDSSAILQSVVTPEATWDKAKITDRNTSVNRMQYTWTLIVRIMQNMNIKLAK